MFIFAACSIWKCGQIYEKRPRIKNSFTIK
nr:MAG TPA: hypothetical protein [Caudoviricetes sp.]DAW54483.1 MAG TPA: hypothetical protein [Caudoviricetes sp.]